jgi:hypothetical protein
VEFLPGHGQNGCGAGETTSKRPRINRLNFGLSDNTNRVATVIELLESLRRPTVFGVRLLDLSNPEYPAVQDFFDVVVKTVVEDEYGFKLTVGDGKQPYEYNRVDQEIFEKLHRSGVVVADITGQRPNFFLELGYARFFVVVCVPLYGYATLRA